MATKRINIMLPETRIRTIDRLVKPGERSHFIDQAIQHYVATRSVLGLHEQLKQAAIRDRDIVREIGKDWVAVDNEPWHINERKEKAGHAGVKSTSHGLTRR